MQFHYINFYKTIITFLLIIGSLFCIAQKKKSYEGYFVNMQNDTVSCTYKTTKWGRQPYQVRIVADSKDIILTPYNSKAFYVSGADILFKSCRLGIALYEHEIQTATSAQVPDNDTIQSLFVRCLYKNTVSLYSFSDKLEKKHFFIESNNGFTEIFKHLYRTIGSLHHKEPIVLWNYQYMYVLKELMTDCKSLYPAIEATELNEEDLIKIMKQYIDCAKSGN